MIATRHVKPNKLIIDSPYSFLYALLEGTTNSHHLTYAFHRTAKLLANTTEFPQVPTRKLHDHVVKTWFKARRGQLRDGVLDLIQRDPKTEFGGDKGKRIAGSFRRKCRRSR